MPAHLPSQNNPVENNANAGIDPENNLLELLTQAEERVDQLREELERRKEERREQGKEDDQHNEIDRLAEHLENAQVNWHQVREFFRSAIDECRSGRPWSTTIPDPGDAQDAHK